MNLPWVFELAFLFCKVCRLEERTRIRIKQVSDRLSFGFSVYRTCRCWGQWTGERNLWKLGRSTGRWGSAWPSSVCWRKVTTSDYPGRTLSVAPSLNGYTSFMIRAETRLTRTSCMTFFRGRLCTRFRIRRYQNTACAVRKNFYS